MTTIYRPWRCYGPAAGHYGWMFEGPDGWYAGSLEMPPSMAPDWLHCKKEQLASRDDALGWFRLGGPADGHDVAPSPYCAVDCWDLDRPIDVAAGVAAHHAAGVGTQNRLDNTCLDEAMRVLRAIATQPISDLPDRREHLLPKPLGCTTACDADPGVSLTVA